MTPVFSPSISFTVPVHTVSEANSRDGWRAKAKRAQFQRGISKVIAQANASTWLRQANAVYLVVTLTRLGTRQLDKGDNLNGSCKAVRDGIADFLGIDDGSDRVEWRYEQRIGRDRNVSGNVEVKLEVKR